MPRRIAKKRMVSLPEKLSMEQCRAVRAKLERDIKKLTPAEKRELNEYIEGQEKLAAKTPKNLQPGMRLSLITYWFVKKGKKV
jgi:hypothetical protein